MQRALASAVRALHRLPFAAVVLLAVRSLQSLQKKFPKVSAPADARVRLVLWHVPLLALAGVVWLSMQPGAVPPQPATARSVDPDQTGSTGGLFENLLGMEDYWTARVTYPTGKFDQAWLRDAALQDAQIRRAVPGGQRVYAPQRNAPLALSPDGFTSLGPMPLNTDLVQCETAVNLCFKFGLVSGRANVIVIDPISPTIAYFGSDGGGVWRSTNCCSPATTWAPVTDSPLLSTISIDDLSFDPNNHNTIYAGTGDLNYGSFSFGSTGILRSQDQGQSWQVLGADVFSAYYPQPAGKFPQYQAVGKVRVDPNNSNILVAGTKTGLFFSYNAGTTWSGPCQTNSFSSQRQDVTGLITRKLGSSTELFAAIGSRGLSTTVQSDLDLNGANGIYSTTVPASGCPASWSLISRGAFSPGGVPNGWPAGTGSGVPVSAGGNPVGRIDMAIAPSDPNVMYAQVADPVHRGLLGFYRTTDGGVTWSRQSGPEVQSCNGVQLVPRVQNWYDQAVAVDPNNSNVVYQSDLDILQSTDGGLTFFNTTCGYETGLARGTVHVDQHALAFMPGSSSTLLAGSDGGIWETQTADQQQPAWVQLNNTISTIEFYSGDISANFANAITPSITAGAQDNGSSTMQWPGQNPSPTSTWTMQFGGDGIFSRLEPKQGLRYYHETPNGALVMSVAGPNGPYQKAAGGWVNDRISFVTPYEMDKYNCPGATCDHMILGSYRVWETISGGVSGGQPVTTTWYPNSPDLTKGTLADRSFINQLAIARTDTSVAMAGTNDGNVWMGHNLATGITNTALWVNVSGGNAVLPNRPILDVAISPGERRGGLRVGGRL